VTVVPTRDEWLSFAVRDSGPGIPAAQLAELFNRFKQADPSISRRHGGTGLGLVIARSLVTLMNGELTVATEVGVGSTFTFTVPAPPAPAGVSPVGSAPAPAVATARPVRDRSAARPLRPVTEGRPVALVVDDHPVNRRVLAIQLDALGVEAETAGDGEEALELFESGRYALVLTDLQMPRMDGFALVSAIRSRESGRGVRTPVLAFTAGYSEVLEERAVAAGFDAIVDKGGVLVAALERWLPV
jgi:CheY-like chemotaxis protein